MILFYIIAPHWLLTKVELLQLPQPRDEGHPEAAPDGGRWRAASGDAQAVVVLWVFN